jgi:hypothetical protein
MTSKTNQRKPVGPQSAAASAPKPASAKSATKTKPLYVQGIATRPRALFERHHKAILRSAYEAFVSTSDDLLVDINDVADDDVQRLYIARRIANLVLEMAEIGEVIAYANATDQNEFAIADELSIQLGVIAKRVVDLGDLYRALKKEAVNV